MRYFDTPEYAVVSLLKNNKVSLRSDFRVFELKAYLSERPYSMLVERLHVGLIESLDS